MPPKSSSDNLSYKKKIKLDLDKLKNGDIQKVKVDLSKFNVKKLAKRVGVLNEAMQRIVRAFERRAAALYG